MNFLSYLQKRKNETLNAKMDFSKKEKLFMKNRRKLEFSDDSSESEGEAPPEEENLELSKNKSKFIYSTRICYFRSPSENCEYHVDIYIYGKNVRCAFPFK